MPEFKKLFYLFSMFIITRKAESKILFGNSPDLFQQILITASLILQFFFVFFCFFVAHFTTVLQNYK